jgi:hypothetical protein
MRIKRTQKALTTNPKSTSVAMVHKIDKNKPFILKLWMMLEYEDPKLLRWQEDGSAFLIPELKAVEDHVLPKYFRGKHFSSFQRQVSRFPSNDVHVLILTSTSKLNTL